MKRLLLLLLCLSALILSGCSEASLTGLVETLNKAGISLPEPDTAAPEIRPALLTGEALEIIELLDGSFDQDIRLIDFTAPADARRLVITQWALEDGQWVAREDDAIGLNGGDSGRIVLGYETLLEGANVAVSMDGVIYSCSHDELAVANVDTPERLTAYLTMPTAITLETDIPLLYQLQSKGTGVSAIPLELWQDTGRFAQYANVALVTVRFSAEPLGPSDPPPP